MPSLGKSLLENDANTEESRAEEWKERDLGIISLEPLDLTMPKANNPFNFGYVTQYNLFFS